MVKKAGKRGDTLVEVMLAVGIFSMVAVAVVAVMSGGTSSSQTALETTLAREEIDTQAEALRFIHSSYTADIRSGSEKGPFSKLWQDITEGAVYADSEEDLQTSGIVKYNPNTCAELYPGNSSYLTGNRAFVINTRKITEYASGKTGVGIGDVIVRASADTATNKLQQASTYPHLIFGGKSDRETELIDPSATAAATGGDSNLYKAEGIFIIAVADPETTPLVGSDDLGNSAYYDFYIRTCWYGTGDQSPSTISTVMRLYNPDMTAPSEP